MLDANNKSETTDGTRADTPGIAMRDIEQEVTTRIESLLREGRTVAAAWITHEIVNTHDAVSGADSDWYRILAFGAMRSLVGKAIRRYKVKPEEEADRQLVLPGYERLQVAYLVVRDREETLVPLQQMSVDEINAKCEQLRAMAQGCLDHADELERYRDEHRPAAA